MDQFFVERDRGIWKIRHDDSHVGIFPTKEMAINWAIERAQNALARGETACVLSQGADHVFRTEWASNRDMR